MKLLIIILNYKVTDLTLDCLRSLEAEVPRIAGTQVAVCENGSGGDAEQRLREAIAANGWAPWVELTAISPNLGFTGGNNVILRKWMAAPESPQYFLLLNADTIVQPGAIEALVRFMDENPRVGIGGSRLEWPDGISQGSPFRFQGIASEFERGLKLGFVSTLLAPWVAGPHDPSKPCEAEWVSGASMIIRKEVVAGVGVLDEGLYTYFDDMDYCLNARRAGWPVWYVPQSRITHLEGASTNVATRQVKRRPEYWYQARRRFFLKNYGPLYTALVDAAFLAAFSVCRLRRMFQRAPDPDPPNMLSDSFRNSVFRTGFELRAVENPALRRP